MSTKTTFKRIALVAVAALGLGVLSVAPSQAVIGGDSLTLSASTAAITTADTATGTSLTLKFAGTTNVDSISVKADFVSGPAVFRPYLVLAETSSVTIDGVANPAAGRVVYPSETTTVLAKSSSEFVSAKWNVVLASPTDITKAASAGTYVVKFTPVAQGSGALIGAAAQTLTITVTTAASLSTVATSATVILNKGETNSATSDAVVTAVKTASTSDAAATIVTELKNAAGAVTTGESYTATVSGPGILGSAAFPSGSPAENGASALGRALTVKAGNIVALFPDGSSGVSTVTISSAAGVILATKKVTFYGDAATITAKATGAATGSVAKVGANSGLISFTVADAAGTEVSTGTYYLVSASTSIVSNSYTACNAWNATDGYTCDVTGVAKGTTTVYVTNRASATATTPTTEVKSGTVSVRVGTTTPASVTVTTDKKTYAPGEKATLTVTVLDSDGNVVPSGTYTSIFATGGITSSYALGAGSDTTTATSVDGAVDGVKNFTLYMPQVVSGDITFSWTTGSVAAAANTGLATANQAVKGSAVVTVVNTVADAATDAANEATDAANAATDAALAAADAADAATAAAQDASDAVAALSASVSKMISSLRAQITSLTNLVIKIQKKVRA